MTWDLEALLALSLAFRQLFPFIAICFSSHAQLLRTAILGRIRAFF